MGTLALELAPLFWERYSKELRRPIEKASSRPTPASWPKTGLHAAWLGHSTVLLQIDGTTLITDPVFSDRVGIQLGPITLGLKRLVSPALRIKELPPIDVVLLSHAHMDHFDLPSLRALENPKTTVVTASKTSDLLHTKRYAGVHELAWGERIQAGGLTIRAFEVRHWGARMQTDLYRGYNGYVIEGGRHRVLFGGDTAFTKAFASARGPREIELAIMPIGAYDPWISAHCTPEQAAQMANDAGAQRILPVHHQTFELSREPRLEPIERLLQSTGEDRVVLRHPGEEFHLD